jgi:hypothetical protein
MDRGELPDLETARAVMVPPAVTTPAVTVRPPDPKAYDALLSVAGGTLA